ncbi:hypothetical protein O6H91_19G058400 [Diphasiastrum complanatum]|uniref:Uncharacterized protein n=2 Tax=Diphasiastrum complanatum TaxID=34168 RepID=A0ACC2ARP3_DIPCM|nr:hypothetical protein O6H91_20G068500 [Diphasiastrum complanatum]KAJ7521532.1 hypothetical protein O6H91_19G058400 [Diphasiastrum complanatum]
MDWRYSDPSSLPGVDEAFEAFVASYPQYSDTSLVDQIREEGYYHLGRSQQQVCLDYTGIGLFSFQQQQAMDSPSASLKLAFVFGNLATHALYIQERTAESILRKRVLSYMNLQPKDYCIVFTANTLCAFKLLAESYPFHLSAKLLLGYDHECENVAWIKHSAKSKEAAVFDAAFVWPELKFDETEMKKMLRQKNRWNRKDGDLAGGLFAYPIVSKITGAKQSFEWVSEAQRNGWNVLLDITGLGVKAMDSLGLSLHRPDFIIGSFYKVFGCDPTGFGCLIINRHILRQLGDSSRARAVGMVKLVSFNSSRPLASPPQGGVGRLLSITETPSPPREGPYEKLNAADWNENGNCRDEEACMTSSKTSDPFPVAVSALDPGFCNEHDSLLQEQCSDFRVVDTVYCRGLDYAEKVGLTRIDIRQWSLLYWLISSLRKLRHPPKGNRHLVMVYGSLSQNDRGSTLAFNLYDSSKTLLDPISVQKLADRNNISLGIGTIQGLFRREQSNEKPNRDYKRSSKLIVGSSSCVDIQSHIMGVKPELFQRKTVQVLCATLGFLSNFGDVYSLWAFLAKFLDPKFICQEHLQYQSLNQETVHL